MANDEHLGDYARSLHVPLIQISQDANHGSAHNYPRENRDTGLCANSSDSDDDHESHALIPEISSMRKRSMSIRSVASTHAEVPKDVTEVLVGVSSVSASSFTFTNFIIQPANPANLPIACLQSGLIAFPLLVTVFGVINCFTCDLLVDAIDIVGQSNAVGFAELLSHRFGRGGWYAGALSVILANFGSLVFTIILIGDMLTPLIGLATGNAILCAHWVWNVGVAVVFLVPMAFIKNMSQLDEASQVAVVILIMLVLSLIGFGIFLIIEPHQRSHFGKSTYHDQCTLKEHFNEPGDKYLILPQSLTFFSALSNLAFSFNAQANVFPLYAELKNRTPKKMKSVNRRAMVMSGIIFILAGVFGYVAFLDATKGNCVKNFPVLQPFGYFMDAVRFLLAVSLVTYVSRSGVPGHISSDCIRLVLLRDCIQRARVNCIATSFASLLSEQDRVLCRKSDAENLTYILTLQTSLCLQVLSVDTLGMSVAS
eukprot:m.382815 g.382815  ORF g.382815 m.382815 type:complete len:483 (-) comp20976_c0_seq19:2688-4136(-)